MMPTSNQHVALVTGASRGIGRAIAQRLSSAGMAVAVTARTLGPGDGRLDGSLEETVELIRVRGGTATPVVADLADPALDLTTVIDAAQSALGAPVDVLVNNAAATRHFEMHFDSMTAEVFRESTQVNVWAAWQLAILAIPGMRTRGAGWILNISSRSAGPRVGPPYPPNELAGQCLYAGTKAMLDRLTTGAAMELYNDNIAVNTLAPESAVATDHALSVAHLRPDHCEPLETMAEAALALCTCDPKMMTGRVSYSLSLLAELNLAVHTLDGQDLLDGWQPDQLDKERLQASYLAAALGGQAKEAGLA
jgi:citronellol/citronellal dehydrogenase